VATKPAETTDAMDKPVPTSIRMSRRQRKLIGRAAVEVEESRQDFILNAAMARVETVLRRMK
jgi:uncharacterized protein (DUF1778 family)